MVLCSAELSKHGIPAPWSPLAGAAVQFNWILSVVLRHPANVPNSMLARGARRIKSLTFGLKKVRNPCNELVPHRRGVFMGFWSWLFGRSRTPDLGLSDGWKPLGNFFEGLHCPLCRAGPGENGLNFYPLVDESGPRLDVMMHMPLLHRAKVALGKKCKGRCEWKWIPQEQTSKDLFIVWRPAPPVPCPIPANATPEERADWELWLQASAAGTTEAFEAYLRDSRLRLFESAANTLLRWKNSMAKPT